MQRVGVTPTQSCSFSGVLAVNWGLQWHSTSIHPGRVMAGILRKSFAIGVIKMSLAVAPHIFAGKDSAW